MVEKVRGGALRPAPHGVRWRCANSDRSNGTCRKDRESLFKMQLSFSLIPEALRDFEAAIAPPRLQRFMENDPCPHKALRCYVWNARLCEEFYLPLQTAEVSLRNAIAETLARRFSRTWHLGTSVPSLLTVKYREHLAEVVQRETLRKGNALTVDHIVSGLSFGFWLNLMTTRYKNQLWQQGLRRSFPHAPANLNLSDSYDKIDQLRRFRNKVAHHFAIFDQSPMKEYNNLLEVTGWVSPTAVWFIRQMANPAKVINARPKY